MIEKLSTARVGRSGPNLVFNTGKELIKTATSLRPDIERFAETIKGNGQDLWLLVHAIGAAEAYSSNNNGDWTSIQALHNLPHDWTGEPAVDRIIAKTWHYGWPTYYNANVFSQHNNKDPKNSIGSVEFVCWNPEMLRVELIIKVNRALAEERGSGWAIRRLDEGQLVDVSMGMRVPFDLSNRETDWDKYNAAVATYNPDLHPTKGHAVLAFHKKDPIPGLSITRNDYSAEVKLNMNKVYPDGSKTFVHNTFPRFFDISIVFIGAEKGAKIMHKFASRCTLTGVKCASCKGKNCDHKIESPAAFLADINMKTASESKTAIENKVGRLLKRGEIEKQTPASFDRASVSAIAERESDLPEDVLRQMAKYEPSEMLSTPSLMGIKLKPNEFQKIVLIRIGKEDLAAQLEESSHVFRPVEDTPVTPVIDHESFCPSLAQLLMPFMAMRSSFSPFLKGRVTMIVQRAPRRFVPVADPVLDKISAAYNAYCADLERSFEKEAALTLHQRLPLREAVYGTGMVKAAAEVIDKYTLAYMCG